jgi:hypothetical protein
MIKRLTLLKIAILMSVVCTVVIAVTAQQFAKQDRLPPGYKEPARVKQKGARKIPSSKKKFSVNQYGAKPGAQTLNTKAIQTAITEIGELGSWRFIKLSE